MTKLKNVILLGRKPGAAQALSWLVERGVNVKLVVASPNEDRQGSQPNLEDVASRSGVPLLFDDAELYKLIDSKDPNLSDIDLVISYLFWKRIKQPLIQLGSVGCINFHPAPLPDYKSRAGYNTAILDNRTEFGVSAHFINSEEFDAGPIIQVLRFPMDPGIETALSLERKSQEKLFELFKDVLQLFLADASIKTMPNAGGSYLTSKQLEELKKIDLTRDSAADVNRKIRAFFFPPYSGAKIIIDGQDFTLINNQILEWVASLIKNAGS
ncbi:MAG: formyltransferase family protein [bacterium]|nr:formyltransferase family protein [bacterium]